MYSLIRPWLFKIDAEIAHALTLSALRYTPRCCFQKVKGAPVRAMGLTFPHPVGLAAGLDKNGSYINALAKLGFSFIEIGTVTPRPQFGNPKPRLFRIPESQALVNRMGFNNLGVDFLVKKVKKAKYKGILGINIGKNKDTLLSKAVEDYVYCLRAVYPYASYITINISSPNTPELRALQRGDYFTSLLSKLREEQLRLRDELHRHVPLVVKISPDETAEDIKAMCEDIMKHGIEGVIATNTSASRELLEPLPSIMRQGGYSGRPLGSLANSCLSLLRSNLGKEVTLIGVGGIHDLASAQEKLDRGASLIQLYSGLIYQGPSLVRELISELTPNNKTLNNKIPNNKILVE
jgi:dihydroorotate dehydrogenase